MVDGNPRPIGPGVRANQFFDDRANENAFTASVRGSVTNSGGTLNLHLKNASGNAQEAVVRDIIINTEFAGELDIFDSFSTAPSSGTSLTIDNLLMDSGGGVDSGNMTANQDVSYTADGTHFQSTVPGGGAGGNIGGSVSATSPIIEPDREIVVELTNTSGTTNPGSIGIVYSERPN